MLLPYEIDALMQAQHRPNYVLQVGRHAFLWTGLQMQFGRRDREDLARGTARISALRSCCSHCAALQVLTHAVRAARVPDQVVLRMHDSLAQLEDALGGCERLLQTPVPIFYTR